MKWPRICPVCGDELPERGNRRRYVSWKRGFRLVHDGACAQAIDAQGVLELAGKAEVVDVVTLVRMRRLAQLLGCQHEGSELLRQPFEHVLALMRRLARLDQPQVGDGLGDRLQGGLLSRDQLVDHMRQLVQRLEVSGPSRTERVA